MLASHRRQSSTSHLYPHKENKYPDHPAYLIMTQTERRQILQSH